MKPGMKIKIERIKRHIKQYEFAEKLGISREYLRLIEKEEANPTKKIMVKIAEELDSTVDELFFN
ncbi:MAG: helix-turn-helix domain-containing protein [Halanaerobiales bacterium]|nr:helix-turn-helix domain-containing protein [Halanaerobiales bacterium]